MAKEKLKIISVQEMSKTGTQIIVDTRFYKIDGTPVFGKFQTHHGLYHLGQICSSFNWVQNDMIDEKRYDYALDELFPGGWEVVEMIEVPYGFKLADLPKIPTKEQLQAFMDHPGEIEDVIQAFKDETVEWLPYRIVMNLIDHKLWRL